MFTQLGIGLQTPYRVIMVLSLCTDNNVNACDNNITNACDDFTPGHNDPYHRILYVIVGLFRVNMLCDQAQSHLGRE